MKEARCTIMLKEARCTIIEHHYLTTTRLLLLRVTTLQLLHTFDTLARFISNSDNWTNLAKMAMVGMKFVSAIELSVEKGDFCDQITDYSRLNKFAVDMPTDLICCSIDYQFFCYRATVLLLYCATQQP